VAGIAQLLTGVISIGQFIGMTVPFMILMLIAIWLTIVLFRNFAEAMTPQEARTRVAHA
jgi:high-affinity K+ transport system ATPase subunit B